MQALTNMSPEPAGRAEITDVVDRARVAKMLGTPELPDHPEDGLYQPGCSRTEAGDPPPPDPRPSTSSIALQLPSARPAPRAACRSPQWCSPPDLPGLSGCLLCGLLLARAWPIPNVCGELL